MRRGVLLIAVPALLAGCMSDPMGMFRLHVTGAMMDAGFESVTASVERVVLVMVGGMRMEQDSVLDAFDLMDLVDGNAFIAHDAGVMAGYYDRIELHLTNGTGVLEEGAEPINIVAPEGRVSVEKSFSINEDKMTDFAFALQVEDLGDGQYRFVSVPEASGLGAPGGMMAMSS